MNARRLVLLLLAVLALAVAGCGGDDSSDAVAETETTAVEETTSDDDGSEDVETVPETTDEDIGELGGECAELAGIGAKLSQSLSGQAGDLDEASEVFNEIAEQVPDEIKADYEVIAENFSKIAEALEGVDLTSGQPDAEAIAKLQELSTTFDSPEVREASANIEAWVTANC